MTNLAQNGVVAFLCENSALRIAQAVKEERPDLFDRLAMVRVPCAGKVDDLYLMRALENGACGVLIMGCHRESCRFLTGNIRAEKRTGRVAQILKELELDPGRVQMVHLAEGQKGRFVEAVENFYARLDPAGVQPASEGEGVEER